jgi:hypothetical protein
MALDSSTVRTLTQDLRGLHTELCALDRHAVDKWESLDRILDDKIEILATAIAAKLKPIPKIAPTSIDTSRINNRASSTSRNFTLWKWVDESVANSIVDLHFDATNLYKLSPPEDASLFDLNLDVASYGGLIIAPNGTVSVVTAFSKLEQSLPSISHWISTFSIYASIRSAFDSTGTYAPVFFMFMREIHRLRLNFPW